MGLFDLGKGVVKQLSLRVVLTELCALRPLLDALDLGWVVDIPALFLRSWRARLKAIRPVVDLAASDCVTHCTVSVEVHDGANRFVDRQLLPVYAETGDLSIEI